MTTVWDRVVGAIDVTPASIQAAVTAAGLMPPAATLTLCAVVGHKALEPTTVVDQALTREAQDRLAQAQTEIQPVRDAELHLREGRPIGRLLDELHAERATLVTVGRPGHARPAGIGLGSVTTAMLQEALCSVLIADVSEHADGELVVGFDGSGGARRALAVSRELAERLSLTLRVIVATGDAHPPGPGWSRQELAPELLGRRRSPLRGRGANRRLSLRAAADPGKPPPARGDGARKRQRECGAPGALSRPGRPLNRPARRQRTARKRLAVMRQPVVAAIPMGGPFPVGGWTPRMPSAVGDGSFPTWWSS